jgi:hypothetical protein
MGRRRFSGYPPFGRDAIRIEARVQPDAIAELCRMMDLYEGVAFVRTKDPRRSVVEFWVSPSFEEDFRQIFSVLKQDVPMEIISENADDPKCGRLQESNPSGQGC